MKQWRLDFTVTIGGELIPVVNLPAFDVNLVGTVLTTTPLNYTGLAVYSNGTSFPLSFTYSVSLTTEVRVKDHSALGDAIKVAFLLTSNIKSSECQVKIELVEELINIATGFEPIQ